MYKSIVALALVALVAGVQSVELGYGGWGGQYVVGVPQVVSVINPVQTIAIHRPSNLGVDIGLGASDAGLRTAGFGVGRRPILGAQFGGAVTAPGLALGGGVRAGISGWGAGFQAGVGASVRCPLCH